MRENFDIKEHILSHDNFTINGLGNIKNHDMLHFKFSIDSVQFLQNNFDADTVMKEIVKKMSDTRVKFKIPNGFYYRKDGTKRQKYTMKKMDLNDCLISYHNEGFDNEKNVEPHIHLLIPKNKRLGKNFGDLKKLINAHLKKHDLIAHFNEQAEKQSTLTKAQKRKVSSFSWQLQKRFFYYSKNKKEFLDNLMLFYKYTIETENISYQVKTMRTLRKALKNEQQHIFLDGKDISAFSQYFLSEDEKKVLGRIFANQFNTVDTHKRSSILSREYIKYSAGLQSIVIEELEKSTGIKIEPLMTNELTIALNKLEKPIKKEKYTPTVNFKQNQIKEKILIAASIASNEKNFKRELGKFFEDDRVSASMRISKKEKIGFKIQKNSRLKTYFFDDYKLNFKRDIVPLIMNKKNLNEFQEKPVPKYKLLTDAETIEKLDSLPTISKMSIDWIKIVDKLEILVERLDKLDKEISTMVKAESDLNKYYLKREGLRSIEKKNSFSFKI